MEPNSSCNCHEGPVRRAGGRQGGRLDRWLEGVADGVVQSERLDVRVICLLCNGGISCLVARTRPEKEYTG